MLANLPEEREIYRLSFVMRRMEKEYRGRTMGYNKVSRFPDETHRYRIHSFQTAQLGHFSKSRQNQRDRKHTFDLYQLLGARWKKECERKSFESVQV
jgi:hypothetical protein